MVDSQEMCRSYLKLTEIKYLMPQACLRCQPNTTACFPQLFLNYFFIAPMQPEMFFQISLRYKKRRAASITLQECSCHSSIVHSALHAVDFM